MPLPAVRQRQKGRFGLESAGMRDARLEKLADVLVNYSVSVRKDQLVRIYVTPLAAPRTLETYRKAVQAGGHVFVRCALEELQENFYKIATDEQLKFVNPLALTEVERIDCSIGLWAEENTRALSNTDPKRISLASAARQPITEIYLKRASEGKLKWVGTQYPANASAQDAEMSLA